MMILYLDYTSCVGSVESQYVMWHLETSANSISIETYFLYFYVVHFIQKIFFYPCRIDP